LRLQVFDNINADNNKQIIISFVYFKTKEKLFSSYMVEYYLRTSPQNIKKLISDLITEIEGFFEMESIITINSLMVYFPELKELIDNHSFQKINNLYFTIEKVKDKYPFLSKYVNKVKTNLGEDFKYVDLFACCGGLSIGLQKAGFKLTFANEYNPVFAETFYFNHDLELDQYYVGDIHNFLDSIGDYKKYLSDLSLVAGGPPCQGFSMANRQRIIDDPRNHLYKMFLEFLSKTKPKFFLMENVKGMSNKIKEILDDFNEYFGDEYDISYGLLNAKNFGVPQNRERFFVIGNRIGIESKKLFSAIRESGKNNQTSFVLKHALLGLPELKPKNIKNNNTLQNEEFGFNMRKNIRKATKYSKFINDGERNRYIFNHKNRFNNERDIEIFQRLPKGKNSLHHSIADIMPYSERNHIFKDKYFKLDDKLPSKTITAHMKFDCNMYIHPFQPRGLSSREAARVQTFPDDYYFRGSQNQWYAQIGNAVPPKMAEIIGKEILKYLL
jgi:DNA (cytosine-5)-methyltransferase 1